MRELREEDETVKRALAWGRFPEPEWRKEREREKEIVWTLKRERKEDSLKILANKTEKRLENAPLNFQKIEFFKDN